METSTEALTRERNRRRLETLAALVKARRFDEALLAAEAAIDAGHDHPLSLGLLAMARQQAGRFDEAIALHERRAQMMAGDPAGWAALAACLFAARRPEVSLEVWRHALRLAPADPALLCGKASVLRSLGRAAEAGALFRQALSASPGLFEAQFGLARLALDMGDQDTAAGLAQQLVRSHPNLPAARWLAARIALDRGDHKTAQAQLTLMLADSGLAPAQRAEALLLQSEALDGLGRTAKAFASAVEAKALQRALYAERAAGREREVDKLNRLADWFRNGDRAAWRTAPDPIPVAGEAAAHVFLLGFPRSGTTLLEQVLAGNPRVAALEEAPTLAAPYAEFMTSDAGLTRLAHLSAEEAGVWRARYWDEVRTHGVQPAGRVFLDKAPAGTLYLPLIAKLFPKAKILFALRDPRDVVLSCLRNNFQLNAMTYAFTDLAETAACYGACMAMAEVYRAVLPLDLREARHETLVDSFDGELASICGFLGIERTPAMADIAATSARRTVRTPSAAQVRAGLNRRGLARWRLYASELAPVLPELTPWIVRYGYGLD